MQVGDKHIDQSPKSSNPYMMNREIQIEVNAHSNNMNLMFSIKSWDI